MILPSLRAICDQAESALEAYWADRILTPSDKQQSKQDAHETVFERLKEFPYYTNYVELTRFELNAIMTAASKVPRKFAFLGSGPMPLTSLCILAALRDHANRVLSHTINGNHDAVQLLEIHNIDRDASAIELSENLCQALGRHGEGMRFVCDSAGSDGYDLSSFDVVYVAALVGRSPAEKEQVMLSIAGKMKPGALLVVRSAWGLKTCLYGEVDITSRRLTGVLEPCLEAHPYGQVVNSVIVARKKPAQIEN